MENKKIIGRYVCILHGNIFDRYKLFGKVIDIDALDNISLKIDRMFCNRVFHKPRLFWWNTFFPKREWVWHDCREENDWLVKIGEVITFPLHAESRGLIHNIKFSSTQEADKYTKKIDELMKIKGGWFGCF